MRKKNINNVGIEFYSRWQKVEIKDIIESANTGLDAIKRAPIVNFDTGIKCLRIQDVSQTKKYEDWGFCNVEERNFKKFQLKKEEIIIARTGATVGVNMFIENDLQSVFNNGLIRIRTNKNKCLPKFLHYTFRTTHFNSFIESISDGTSTQPNMQINALLTFEIALPPLKEQTHIANILTSLDNKIDLLNNQNKTLEQLAETLFRQWFVEEAEQSWEVVKLKDVCITISKGTTPTTLGKQFKSVGINFIKAESLADDGCFIPEKFAFIDEETDELLKRSRIQQDDVLITIAGTIGRIAFVTKEILPANTNQAIGFMRANKEIIAPYFIYCLFKTEEIKNDFDSRIVHAVQPNLSLGEIGNIEFRLPPKNILAKGMLELQMLLDKKQKNIIQIRNLNQTRDTLLPKLMSGEVRVNL